MSGQLIIDQLFDSVRVATNLGYSLNTNWISTGTSGRVFTNVGSCVVVNIPPGYTHLLINKCVNTFTNTDAAITLSDLDFFPFYPQTPIIATAAPTVTTWATGANVSLAAGAFRAGAGTTVNTRSILIGPNASTVVAAFNPTVGVHARATAGYTGQLIDALMAFGFTTANGTAPLAPQVGLYFQCTEAGGNFQQSAGAVATTTCSGVYAINYNQV